MAHHANSYISNGLKHIRRSTRPGRRSGQSSYEWLRSAKHPGVALVKDGGVYNVGFAVHDDSITTRGHQVSFVKTLGFGARADIQAVKLPRQGIESGPLGKEVAYPSLGSLFF